MAIKNINELIEEAVLSEAPAAPYSKVTFSSREQYAVPIYEKITFVDLPQVVDCCFGGDSLTWVFRNLFLLVVVVSNEKSRPCFIYFVAG